MLHVRPNSSHTPFFSTTTRFLSLHVSQEILTDNGGHATMGTSVPRRAPHGNGIHVAHPTCLSAGRARYGTVLVGSPARRPGQGDGATRARDVWPSVLDCAAAGDCRAGGPVDFGAPATDAQRLRHGSMRSCTLTEIIPLPPCRTGGTAGDLLV